MSDTLTPEQRHRVMAAVHSNSTKPEVVLRKALWSRGVRYRCNDKRLPGSPDLVLPKYRTVLFVHGCFWHAHQGCKSYTVPKSNTDYWTAKVANNRQRDQEVWRKLEAKGWYVIVVWECELKKKNFNETIQSVVDRLAQNGRACELARKERREARAAYWQERKERKEKESREQAELLSIYPR